MSWFSSNYDKALLGGGAVVSLGLLYFGWSQLNRSGEDFSKNLMGGGKGNAAVAGAEQITVASQSMELDHGWKQGEFEGRKVDLFTGIPLFIKRDKPDQAIDLLKDEPVHPPIPNSFWLEYDIDPGFADAPQQDPDGDGFSNLEEYNDQTHPKDGDSHPLLIKKLRYVGDETASWLLLPGFLGENGSIPMKYEDTKGQRNSAGAANPVLPGQLFFANGAAQGRFKFLGHEKRQQMNAAINVMEEITFAKIEDQKANKAGNVYAIPAPMRQGDKAKFIQHDRSAVLVLEALGQGGKQIVIEENTTFALPADAKKKDYKLKSVTPQEIVVEYPGAEGGMESVVIPKGELPRL